MKQINTSRYAGFLYLFLSLFISAQVSAQMIPVLGFPDADADSGRMVNVTRGFATLGDSSGELLNVSVRIPASQANVTIEVFDGNSSTIVGDTTQGFWDSFSPLNNSTIPDEVEFKLYPDPNLVGNTSGTPMLVIDGATLADDAWDLVADVANVESARINGDPAEDFSYHLVAEWKTELLTNMLNAFKVRANGLVFTLAGSTIGFQGYVSILGVNDSLVPFPVFYDGTFNFAVELRENECVLDIYDGDLDRGDDTDDPNTPNDGVSAGGFYPFPLSPVTVDEAVNPGAPADDTPVDLARFSPSVQYTVAGPTGLLGVTSYSVVNDNPSGNREFELFRIASSAPGCPDPTDPGYDPPVLSNGIDPPAAVPDVVVPGLGAGFHFLGVIGLDAFNNAFINASGDILAVDSLFDFGDAPVSYSSGGLDPSHRVIGNLLMGTEIDIEVSSNPGVNAVGDDLLGVDDEDGVVFSTALSNDLAGSNYVVDVAVFNGVLDVSQNPVNANLIGWIDFDGNGMFEIDESASVVVPSTGSAASVQLTFMVPFDILAGDTYARFRLTNDPLITLATPFGMADNGEVEDYKLTVESTCGLSVNKTCLVQAPVSGPFNCSDAKPIDVLGMIWDGTDDVRIKAWKGNVGSTLLADIDNISFGDEVTVSGFAGSPNDVYWEIFIAGTDTKLGESKFHLSCSDDDMDGPEDCGAVLGDGKDNNTGFVNAWILELLSGNGETLDCTAATPTGAVGFESCEFEAGPNPSCETGKPDNLTWQYTGGGCAASDNDQKPGDATCLGSIDGSVPVVILDDKGNLFNVNPGDEFTTKRDASKKFSLVNNTGQEFLTLHESCSQPLQAGDVYGSLTLVALDGQRAGQAVDYFYEVTNDGTPLTDVTLIDNLLGQVGGPIYLATGDSAIFTASAMINGTTTNIVDVTGMAGSGACEATDSTTVTMTPCSLDSQGLVFGGHEIKWKLTNTNDFNTTISRITISWPSANGDLKEVKRAGDTIHKGIFSPTLAVIESGWEGNADKRVIKAGETKELKFKFDNDVSLDGEYTITIEFSSGCVVTETYTPPISGGDFSCEKPIDSLTMIWDGDVDVTVDAWKGSVGSTLLISNAPVSVGGELTVSGYAGSPNDVFWEIFDANTGEKIGESKFHLSCSDNDMNGPEDCGTALGDGKDNNSDFINNWMLEGMIDAMTTLDCTDGSGDGPTDPTSSQTTSSRVSSGSDDAEERLSDGDMYINSTDLELVDDIDYRGGRQLVGMRFNSLNIPQSVTITNAYIEFETDETSSTATSLVFTAQAADNATPFADVAYNLSSRTPTAASVSWNNVLTWNTESEKHQTPDLSAIIQAVVDRSGWVQGNSLAVLVSGSGERTAESYEGDPLNAPLLVVEYTTGP